MSARAALLGCVLAAACGGEAAGFGYPLDGVLRLNHLQMKGTHNSYHVEPATLLQPDWAYTMAPLAEQAELQGVRQFELDVHYESNEGRFSVFHIPGLDKETTCFWLRDCLAGLKGWSDRYPGHHPIVVFVEPKDDVDTAANKIVGKYEELEAEILAVWPRERLLTPDDVSKGHATLAAAVAAGGWPTLGELRGKAVFALLDRNHTPGAHHYEYTHGATSLAGRLMFASADPADPYAAVILKDDPRKSEEINALVDRGFFVRTFPEDDVVDGQAQSRVELEAALSGAAHAISSNYPVAGEAGGWWVDLAPGTPTRCNPRTAPKECTAAAIESPERLRK